MSCGSCAHAAAKRASSEDRRPPGKWPQRDNREVRSRGIQACRLDEGRPRILDVSLSSSTSPNKSQASARSGSTVQARRASGRAPITSPFSSSRAERPSNASMRSGHRVNASRYAVAARNVWPLA